MCISIALWYSFLSLAKEEEWNLSKFHSVLLVRRVLSCKGFHQNFLTNKISCSLLHTNSYSQFLLVTRCLPVRIVPVVVNARPFALILVNFVLFCRIPVDLYPVSVKVTRFISNTLFCSVALCTWFKLQLESWIVLPSCSGILSLLGLIILNSLFLVIGTSQWPSVENKWFI